MEIHINLDQEQKRSTGPVNVCYCCDCVSYSFDEHGNPKFHCQDTVLTEDGSNNTDEKRQVSIRNPQVTLSDSLLKERVLQQQSNLRSFRRTHASVVRRKFNNHNFPKRSKRSPFDWDSFFNKISLMGSHDSTYTKRTEGYFHYNFGNNKSTTSSSSGNMNTATPANTAATPDSG